MLRDELYEGSPLSKHFGSVFQPTEYEPSPYEPSELASVGIAMKSLALLVFLFLFIPGSGELVWDGLPLNSRAEIVALVLFVVVVFSSRVRVRASTWLKAFRWNGLLKPGIAILCLLKFLSFAWSPMSQGFEACYRSLYNPIEDSKVCEKSFDAPFLRANGLPFKNTSRVEPTVDFGKSPYDWSLPFMNEYPRLGALWLERFPFQASYFAALRGESENTVLPIYAIGELSARVANGHSIQAINYDRPFLSVLRLPRSSEALFVDYQYRDEEQSDPETRPAPRGPYAQLKIGDPMSLNDLLTVARVRLTGTVSFEDGTHSSTLTVRDSEGNLVEVNDVNAQRRSESESDELLRLFDIEIEFAANNLERSPLEVQNHKGDTLGVVTVNKTFSLVPQFKPSAALSGDSQLGVALTVDRSSLKAATPGVRDTPGPALRSLLVFIDAATLLTLLVLFLAVMTTMKLALFQALVLAALAWIAVKPLDAILPSFLGGGRELVVPYALISALLVWCRNKIVKFPLAFLLPLSLVLAWQKVFEHLHFNHPGQGDHWWGNLLFYWRDSDWFANNGYARTIFVEGSLQGGERVFWFQAAPRYLAVVARYVLGENDVLIGLIAVTLGFLTVGALVAKLASSQLGPAGNILAMFAGFIGLIFFGDQMITALGFFVASEYPTWIAILGTTAFLLDPRSEPRIWVIASMSGALAAIVHFRPNNLFVSVALFVLVICRKTDRENHWVWWRQVGWAIASYAIVLSLSLIHNLYYGARFTPFTGNASINYAFSWTEIWSTHGIGGALSIIWAQVRALMYWRVPNDPSYAIVFWGAQLLLLAAIFERARKRVLRSFPLLFALLPLSYIAPMLKFQYSSYYPRHLVAASLLCMCCAILVWPRTLQRRR